MWGHIQSHSSTISLHRKQHLPIPRSCWSSGEDCSFDIHISSLGAPPTSLKRPTSKSSGLTLESLLGDSESFFRESPPRLLTPSKSAPALMQLRRPDSQKETTRTHLPTLEANHIKAVLKIAEDPYDADEHEHHSISDRKLVEGFSKEGALLHISKGKRSSTFLYEADKWQNKAIKHKNQAMPISPSGGRHKRMMTKF